MALWLQEQEYDALPLGQYQASRGAYLAAVADDAWQQNPLPSLLRWNERLRDDYGQLGGTLRFLDPFLPGGRENFEAGFRALGAPDGAFKPESRWLTIDEVHERGKALGLKAERGMSEAAFESIAAARRRKLEHDAIYQRARLNEGYGPGLAALSVALEFAVSAADPLNLATAFLPLARLPGLAGLVARVPAGGARRFATGAIEGGLGNLAVEPAVALAAADEDPNYGWTNALLTLAFGVGLGGGLHWLGGRFSDRFARGEPERTVSARSVLETRPEAAQAIREGAPEADRPPLRDALPASPEAAGGPFRETPQLAAARIEALHPETRAALAETALRQAGTDQAVDVHALAGMDRNWRPIMARAEGPAYRLGGWDEAQIKRELAEQRSILDHLALARDADRAARLKAPAGWEPTPALLKQAKAYVRPPKVAKEPMRLAQMVRAEGGLNIASIEAQNLKATDLGPLSGLVRTRRRGGVKDLQGAKQQLGKGVDELIDAAMARGFYPQERPDAAKFIADLIEDAQDQRRIHAMGRDQPDIGAYDMTRLERQRWEQGMEAHPLGDPRDLDPKDLAYYLSLDPVERRLAELDDLKARGAISEAESLERAAMIDRALAEEEAAAARDLVEAITAWHGSPHEFDAFDISKIGTGEGEQAYGHGLYLAEREGVARFYADKLSARIDDFEDPQIVAATMLEQNKGDRAAAVAAIDRILKSQIDEGATYSPDEIMAFEVARSLLEDGRPIAALPGEPHVYEVKINAKPAQFYDLDKPLRDQSALAQKAVRKVIPDADVRGDGDLTLLLTKPDPELSKKLKAAGLAGFRYLDQGSRDAGDGTRNFVVFDDKLIEIVSRDGKPIERGGRPEGFEKDVEAPLREDDTAPLTEAEHHALAERSGLPEAPPGDLPGGAGRSAPAAGGEERGAAGALSQPAEPAAAGAVSGPRAQETFRAEAAARLEGGLTGEASGFATSERTFASGFDPREFDLWLQRQADWRADAHASPAAAARADAIVAERQAVTPEQDLAELEASVGKLLDEASKEELKAVSDAHAEAKAMVDAFAACRMGARDGG